MKKSLLLVLFSLSLGLCFSQTTNNMPKANVQSRILNTDTTEYTFTSNYYISDYKAPLLTKRMLERYPEIIDIEILAQTITFSILIDNSEPFLENFVQFYRKLKKSYLQWMSLEQ